MGGEWTDPRRAGCSALLPGSTRGCTDRRDRQLYLHQLPFLLLAAADGVPDGAHLGQDGLRLLQLVAMRAVGDLLVDPGGQRDQKRAV